MKRKDLTRAVKRAGETSKIFTDAEKYILATLKEPDLSADSRADLLRQLEDHDQTLADLYDHMYSVAEREAHRHYRKPVASRLIDRLFNKFGLKG